MTLVLAAASASLVLTSAAPSRADDAKGVCVASYEHSQVSRREGNLKRARDELRQCARAACPALVRNDCMQWLEQVESSYPSIVIRAERDGADVAAMRVFVDNELVASRLDGKAIEIDPGEHAFRFEAEGAPPIAQQVVVREGEKNRVVTVKLPTLHAEREATAAAAPKEVSRPTPAGVYVLGGVGVAGLASFAVFAALGKSDEGTLERTCSPNCGQSDVDAVKSKYMIADLSLGVGAASLAAATVWYFLRPTKETTAAPASGVAVVPSRGGATVQWAATF